MSVDWWKSFFDVVTVVLAGGVFVAGAGALITGRILNQRQDSQLRQFDRDLVEAKTELGKQQERAAKLEAGNLALKTELEHATAESRSKQTELEVEQRKTAEAQEKAAKAQLELQKRVELVGKEAGQRTLSPRFAEALKGKPTGVVRILYAPEDTEAYGLALDIWHTLRDAGWTASLPKPIPNDERLPGVEMQDAPAQLRHGTSGSLALIANRQSADSLRENTALGAIWNAFTHALDVSWGGSISVDPTLADDHFVIVVGQR